jgi:Protein of unknown function (DUF1493)
MRRAGRAFQWRDFRWMFPLCFAIERGMKVDGARLSDEEVFACVAKAVHELTDVPTDRIRRESRIAEDLRLWGDDGWDLIGRLDRQFEVDWSGFDGGIHFGGEGFGPPFPWHVSRSPAVFEPQPLTVGQLTDAIRRGRWPGTPKIPCSRGRRLSAYAASWTMFGFLLAVAVIVIVPAILRAAEG